MDKRFYLRNVRLSACVLFSSNVTNEAWKKEQSQIVSESKQRGSILSGVKRCDSPDHNAKYISLIYFLIKV